ncbi:hypothetical protein WJX74_009123 [Apatococcus lobatus]|uniref:[Histone H3]-lysine(27) N-trimethyltransferase n=2 Tax=Apatococcus TaxID=904362 RepID=A0AAW1T270_9CHLO
MQKDAAQLAQPLEGEALRRAVFRKIASLRKIYAEKQRHEAQQILARNKEKSAVWLRGQADVDAYVLPKAKTVPPYKAWIYLMRNELAAETGRRMFYTDKTGETIPASDSEEELPGNMVMDGIHRQQQDHVLQGVVQEFGKKHTVLLILADKLDTIIATLETRLQELAEDEKGAGSQSGRQASLSSSLQPMDGAFCRRCCTFSCLAHHGSQVKPQHIQPAAHAATDGSSLCGLHCWRQVASPAGLPAVSLFKQLAQRAGQLASTVRDRIVDREAALGHGAGSAQKRTNDQDPPPAKRARPSESSQDPLKDFRSAAGGHSDGVAAAQSPGSDGAASKRCSWPGLEEEMYQKGLATFGGDPCRIARLIGSPSASCQKVHGRLKAEGLLLPALGGAGPQSAPPRKPAFIPRKRNDSKVASARLAHPSTQPWPGYEPCQCAGSCGKDCSCLASKNFCEKFCGCDAACAFRFQGCVCQSGCRTKACPCYAAGHECDPDICQACAPTCEQGQHGGRPCHNMRLRLRQHKRVAMGLSRVAGWGAFLQEDAKKGELLGEYTGELIDQAEADRRGKVYDRDDNSYLFNLNKEWVIDARQRGNKLRFANHNVDPNSYAEILMVDGDHRVGIFARRDIPAGAELFYDYRYDTMHAPQWAHK